ncbi:MAG: DUF4254 domain-containing protein [Polaromonas sp.]|jgi:hypothetical protein|nr:DUF4254 domain-containing protein [Polaromonas sp.]
MTLLTSQTITKYHDNSLAKTFGSSVQANGSDPAKQHGLDEVQYWVAENHLHNCLLWSQEDLARRTCVPDAEIVANKRAIDRHNQSRNDAIERIDECLLLALGLVTPASARSDSPVIRPSTTARLNSETAGSMIDRLSILSLKIHAMKLQSQRQDATDAHRKVCTDKCARLVQQRSDLASCLDRLLADTKNGHAWFQVYRQFKMYNDANLNPALLAESLRNKKPAFKA